MSSYSGPAEIIAGDIQAPAYVDLNSYDSGGFRAWSGTIDVDTDGDAWAVFQASQIVLCLPDGREGNVVATNLQAGSTGIAVIGSGPAPF
ncbi:hypothetical protein ACWGB8_01745 [Kitasatospora sp. NPDC054939]